MKPKYEKPKLHRLDENIVVVGQNCQPGSNAAGNCVPVGNSATNNCLDGNIPARNCNNGNGVV